MGQYHFLLNLDKHEQVYAHSLGLGLKQAEHTSCVASLSDVLYVLLAVSTGKGGGDLEMDAVLEAKFQTFGRWVGDRVVVIGDYAELSDFPGGTIDQEYLEDWQERSTDITLDILPAIELAFHFKIKNNLQGWKERTLDSYWDWMKGE